MDVAADTNHRMDRRPSGRTPSPTDLDVSQRLYTELFGFVVVMDVGYGRICMRPSTGFSLALLKHPDAFGGAFTELHTGVDHLGLAAASREELEHWERRFDEHGVTYTPIRATWRCATTSKIWPISWNGFFIRSGAGRASPG